MSKKISIFGNSVFLSKEICSEIIPARRLMRLLIKECDFMDMASFMARIYGLTAEEIGVMYYELVREKEVHYGRPKALTDAHRAFIEENRQMTGKELYELLRANMGYTGSLKTVQNELTKSRSKHRVDF